MQPFLVRYLGGIAAGKELPQAFEYYRAVGVVGACPNGYTILLAFLNVGGYFVCRYILDDGIALVLFAKLKCRNETLVGCLGVKCSILLTIGEEVSVECDIVEWS